MGHPGASPEVQGTTALHAASSELSAACCVCAGGWKLYWILLLDRQPANLCDMHIAEGMNPNPEQSE